MFGKKDAQADFIVEPFYELHGLVCLLGRHPCRRFVEKKKVGLACQCQCQFQFFLVTLRKYPRLGVSEAGNAGSFEEAERFFLRKPFCRGKEVECFFLLCQDRLSDIFIGCQFRIDIAYLEGPGYTDPGNLVPGPVCNLLSPEKDVPSGDRIDCLTFS